jgi:hypothetical protein
MTRVVVVVALVLKIAAPQQRSWCVVQLAKKEPVIAMQRTFRALFGR